MNAFSRHIRTSRDGAGTGQGTRASDDRNPVATPARSDFQIVWRYTLVLHTTVMAPHAQGIWRYLSGSHFHHSHHTLEVADGVRTTPVGPGRVVDDVRDVVIEHEPIEA